MKKYFVFLGFLMILNHLWGLKFNAGFDFELGVFTSKDKNQNVLRFFPKIQLEDFNLKAGLDFFYTTNGSCNYYDFKDWRAFISKLQLCYTNASSPFNFLVERVNDFTFGSGFILRNFTTSRYYPEFYFNSAQININFKFLSFNLFTDNILDFDINGARMLLKPLFFFAGDSIFGNSYIAFTGVCDIDPLNPVSFTNETSAYNFTDSKTNLNVFVYGIEMGIPAYKNNFFLLSFNMDYASIYNNGSGVSFGTVLRGFDFVELKLNYGFSEKKFMPFYFDNLYDLERYEKYQKLNEINEEYQFYDVGLFLFIFSENLKFSFELIKKRTADSFTDIYISLFFGRDYFKVFDFTLTYFRPEVSKAEEVFLPLSSKSTFLTDFNFYMSEMVVFGLDYRYTFTFEKEELTQWQTVYLFIKAIF